MTHPIPSLPHTIEQAPQEQSTASALQDSSATQRITQSTLTPHTESSENSPTVFDQITDAFSWIWDTLTHYLSCICFRDQPLEASSTTTTVPYIDQRLNEVIIDITSSSFENENISFLMQEVALELQEIHQACMQHGEASAAVRHSFGADRDFKIKHLPAGHVLRDALPRGDDLLSKQIKTLTKNFKRWISIKTDSFSGQFEPPVEPQLRETAIPLLEETDALDSRINRAIRQFDEFLPPDEDVAEKSRNLAQYLSTLHHQLCTEGPQEHSIKTLLRQSNEYGEYVRSGNGIQNNHIWKKELYSLFKNAKALLSYKENYLEAQ